MKLHELKQAYDAAKKGTYAGIRFDDNTKNALHDYMMENQIPNMLDRDQLHTTLLYSRIHCPKYQPAGTDMHYVGTPGGFVLWDTSAPGGEGQTKCLVLKFDSPELTERHHALRREHGATHDYEDFNPHITLSYDIGNRSLNTLSDIRKHLSEIHMVEEYGEDLDWEWKPQSG